MKTKYAFTIFKDGTTERPINIVYPENEKYNIPDKKSFYESLGYTVTFLTNKK